MIPSLVVQLPFYKRIRNTFVIVGKWQLRAILFDEQGFGLGMTPSRADRPLAQPLTNPYNSLGDMGQRQWSLSSHIICSRFGNSCFNVDG